MAEPKWAEDWQEVARTVKILEKAIDNVPAPPEPDDDFGSTFNGVKTNFEQFKQHVFAKANIELEQRNAEDE